VLGAAGLGKTRLAAELIAEIGERATVLEGRCLSYGEGITFWPLQEILRGLRERPAGAPDPERARGTEETFWAYRKLFEALATERPLVLVLEDIHWAEPTLLDLIEHIVEWTREAPMLIVCVARPDLLDERPGWPGELIDLEPLRSEEAETLVAMLATGVDPAIRVRAIEVAEGNPLFLEQLLALAVEDGHEVAVPDTIQALLSARLDQVAPGERGPAGGGSRRWQGVLARRCHTSLRTRGGGECASSASCAQRAHPARALEPSRRRCLPLRPHTHSRRHLQGDPKGNPC
jgi:predicted ATPase